MRASTTYCSRRTCTRWGRSSTFGSIIILPTFPVDPALEIRVIVETAFLAELGSDGLVRRATFGSSFLLGATKPAT